MTMSLSPQGARGGRGARGATGAPGAKVRKSTPVSLFRFILFLCGFFNHSYTTLQLYKKCRSCEILMKAGFLTKMFQMHGEFLVFNSFVLLGLVWPRRLTGSHGRQGTFSPLE